MVGDPLIPPAERLPGGFFDHGLLVIVSGETPHRDMAIPAGTSCPAGQRTLPASPEDQAEGVAGRVLVDTPADRLPGRPGRRRERCSAVYLTAG